MALISNMLRKITKSLKPEKMRLISTLKTVWQLLGFEKKKKEAPRKLQQKKLPIKRNKILLR